MRVSRAILLALLCAGYNAQAQAQTLVVEARGQAPGTYYLELTLTANGQLSARVLDHVLRLTAAPAPTPPAPTPPTTPTTPTTLDSPIARAAFAALTSVTDLNKEHQRLQLAILYRELKEHIGREFTAPWQTLADATRQARVALLGEQGETNWRPWVQAVAVEFTALEKQAGGQGLQADQLRGAYGQVAIGLEHQPDGQARAMDPQVRQLIVRIVRLILEQLLAGQAAGAA